MGAQVFMVRAKGATAQEAFRSAVASAQYNSGHGGYTGTIAEKCLFTMIPRPPGEKPEVYADRLIDAGDERVDDTWGPAGAIEVAKGEFLFFGWASS